MGTSLGTADTMTLIASKLSPLVPFASYALFLHEEAGDVLRCRFATGVDADLLQSLSVPNGQGLVGWVGRNQRSLANARPSADLEAAGVSGDATSLRSALVCPLVFEDRLIGALALYHTEAACFTDDHRRLLERVAEQAAGVVRNSIVFEQTKRDSLTDPLTGLPNTRFMIVHLSRELARAERLGNEVSMMVMDLDGFKAINDTYGHHVGDKALREVARVLRNGIRPYDICVRYAGDEFVVVLSGCGAAEADQKRRELQQAIEDVPFEVRPGRQVKLGSSFGFSVFPHDGESYETLLATADKRMYQDKSDRKTRTLAPEAEPATPAKRTSVFAKSPGNPAPTGRTKSHRRLAAPHLTLPAAPSGSHAADCRRSSKWCRPRPVPRSSGRRSTARSGSRRARRRWWASRGGTSAGPTRLRSARPKWPATACSSSWWAWVATGRPAHICRSSPRASG